MTQPENRTVELLERAAKMIEYLESLTPKEPTVLQSFNQVVADLRAEAKRIKEDKCECNRAVWSGNEWVRCSLCGKTRELKSLHGAGQTEILEPAQPKITAETPEIARSWAGDPSQFPQPKRERLEQVHSVDGYAAEDKVLEFLKDVTNKLNQLIRERNELIGNTPKKGKK